MGGLGSLRKGDVFELKYSGVSHSHMCWVLLDYVASCTARPKNSPNYHDPMRL